MAFGPGVWLSKIQSTWLFLVIFLTVSHTSNWIGGTEEVWTSCELAARVHHGGYTYTAEKGDGIPT